MPVDRQRISSSLVPHRSSPPSFPAVFRIACSFPKTGLDRKTEKPYLPRHLIAIAAAWMWRRRERVVYQRANDPRGWVCTGKAATAVFLRTTKRITAYKEVGGSLRLQDPRTWNARCRAQGLGSPEFLAIVSRRRTRHAGGPGAEASNRSRKSQCPSPPWDTAFPGAFFLR